MVTHAAMAAKRGRALDDVRPQQQVGGLGMVQRIVQHAGEGDVGQAGQLGGVSRGGEDDGMANAG